jgi:hypothetical protein
MYPTLSVYSGVFLVVAGLLSFLIYNFTKPSYLKNIAGPPTESKLTGEHPLIK